MPLTESAKHWFPSIKCSDMFFGIVPSRKEAMFIPALSFLETTTAKCIPTKRK
jgi:hypothetical protein